MRGKVWLFGLAAALIVAFYGCGGSGSSDNGSSGAAPAAADNPNQDPTSSGNAIAGKTFQFTVTMSLNFSEPLGAIYTVDYHTDGTYTFHPSPQNRESQYPENGTFTYDPNTGLIHYSRPDHQDIDGQFTFTSSTSGTVRLMGPEGEVEEATFQQI